jgi:nucleoside-diphosphate-sugar epimerase
MKRALITGATGYIGSQLVNRLLSEKWNVSIIARESSSLERLKGNIDNEGLNIHLCNDDYSNIDDIVKKSKPEVVFHLAAYFFENSYKDINNLIDSNVCFGTNLLEAMKRNNIRYFINTGTYWQCYKNEEYNPVNLYAATKEAFEKVIKYYIETSDIRVITLRLFDVYGPNDNRNKLITSLEKFMESKESLLLSKGEQIMDYVFIEDVINAYLAAYEYLKNNVVKNEVFGISSDERYSLKEVIQMVEEILGKKLNIILGGKPYRSREVMIPWQDYRVLPNWRPITSLKTGLEKCYKKI